MALQINSTTTFTQTGPVTVHTLREILAQHDDAGWTSDDQEVVITGREGQTMFSIAYSEAVA